MQRTVSVIFLIRGSGTLSREDSAIALQAPALLVLQPGQVATYGPGPGETWQEVWWTYSAADTDILHARRLLPTPMTRVIQGSALQGLEGVADEAQRLAQRVTDTGIVDLLDRLAERVLIHASLPDGLELADPLIVRARSLLRERMHEATVLATLPDDLGVSPATFRRHWSKVVSISPARYLAALRLQRAAVKLRQERTPIQDIAILVGYADPMHFSRAFRQCYGVSPRAYRQGAG